MKTDYQKLIFDEIKRQTKGQDSLGNIVGDVLSISQDAVYRRYRGETPLTINELRKLAKHFHISLDTLFEMNDNKVLFDIPRLEGFDSGMDAYFNNIFNAMKMLKAHKNPEITMTIVNAPLLQLFNFPHLVRFKLFFWAKSELQHDDFRNIKFDYNKIPDQTFSIGKEILQIYNSIPSKEIYDQEVLIGMMREILYYVHARLFQDPSYALRLFDYMDEFIDHLEAQASTGKKFIAGTSEPAFGNSFEMYYNETNNGVTSIYYKAEDHEGLYIAHNRLNLMHTADPRYLEETRNILKKQVSAASLISQVNDKERSRYFHQIKNNINQFRNRVKVELEV